VRHVPREAGIARTLLPGDDQREGFQMASDEIPATLEVDQVYAIEAEYAPDGANRRRPVRRQHLERFERLVREGTILFGGALGDVESALIVVRTPDAQAARDLAEQDIYWTSGTWSSIRIRPYAMIRIRGGHE
jgi:uncharacterized protein YciI